MMCTTTVELDTIAVPLVEIPRAIRTSYHSQLLVVVVFVVVVQENTPYSEREQSVNVTYIYDPGIIQGECYYLPLANTRASFVNW